MKLDNKERKILAAIELKANQSVAELSKTLGQRPHNVRYQLQRLVESGLLTYRPVINLRSCGYKEYEVFFTLPDRLQVTRPEVMQALAKTPNVISVKEYLGDYDCSITIAASSAENLSEHFESLSSSFGFLFSSKVISSRVSTSIFNKKYLSTEAEEEELRIPPETVCSLDSLDGLDYSILREITSNPQVSLRKLSQQMSLPPTTVHFRLKKLERKGVVVGYRYALDTTRVGISSYKFFFTAKTPCKNSRIKLRLFCKSHPNIVEFIHCVGCWDYECRVEVESAEQLAELRRELHEQFEQDLASIRFVNILRNTGTEYGGFFGTLEKEFLPNTEEHGSLPYTSVSMAIKDSKNGRASSATPLNLGA